jgi:predicted acetyltransferase
MELASMSALTVVPAGQAELDCIENLMQFYNYELSQWYPIEFATTGLYDIKSKKSYWADSGTRPYLLRVGDAIAGFAVIDTETFEPECSYNLGYFFVTRRYRGHGVGTTALSSLFQQWPGTWEIYNLARNSVAEEFWKSALAKTGVLSWTTSSQIIQGEPSTLHRFSIPDKI